MKGKGEKMKDIILHNLGLKIVAILCAVVLWAISMNINDPVGTNKYTVNVELLNMQNMTNEGKYVEVLDDTDVVKVEVKASTSVLNSMSANNLVVTADLNELDQNNQIPITVSTTKTIDTQSITLVTKYVKVSVEDIDRIQIPIDVIAVNEPAEGYMISETDTVQNAMTISGPESVVSQIKNASVEINIAGANSDVNINLPISLYDSEGNKIDDEKLTLSVSEVSTTATILQTKSVPLIFEMIGETDEDYMLTGVVEQTPSDVLIAGKSDKIKNITKIEITDGLDITAATENVISVVEVKDYLPEGIILGNDAGELTASAIAYVEKIGSRTIDLEPSHIEILNMPEGYEGVVESIDGEISITLTGLQSELNMITIDDIVGTIDMVEVMAAKSMETIKIGTYSTDITFIIPNNVIYEDSTTVAVRVDEEE